MKTEQVKRASASKDAVFNPKFLSGDRFPLAYWLRAKHKVEAQYIQGFGDLVTQSYNQQVKAGVPLAEIDTDIILVASYRAKVLHTPKVASTDGNVLLDTEGFVVKGKTKAQTAKLMKQVKDHLALLDDVAELENDKDEEWGEVLGWMNWWFVEEIVDNDGKDQYILHRAPRSTTLRAKIPGHKRAHKMLIGYHDELHLLSASFAYANPVLNTHNKGSSSTYNEGVLKLLKR